MMPNEALPYTERPRWFYGEGTREPPRHGIPDLCGCALGECKKLPNCHFLISSYDTIMDL